MRTIEEITAAMQALVDGAAERSLTADEVTAYEALEVELREAQADAQIRARHTAYTAPRLPAGPARVPVATIGREALPYQARQITNRVTGDVEVVFAHANENSFTADLRDMSNMRDQYGTDTEQGRRVMALLRHELFTAATVTTPNIDELNPNIQRPDMFVDQQDYRTPLIDAIGRGAPPNGVQPFTFPKYSSSSGLVGDHTEGTEPTGGTYVTTSQTVTPTAISGKASITREVWEMGGNPAVDGLIFGQMKRGYREGLETSAATFLNTLTAATDINLNTGATAGSPPTSIQLAQNWESALAGLQFTRGYDFSVLVLEQLAYQAFAAARDSSNRPFYPILAPQNANGTSAPRFRTLDLAGVLGIPSWALTSTPGSVNNSWLFDRDTVFGWFTAPQRLEFPGTNAAGAYAPVAMVDLAVWGYKAFANTDIGGVRQVTYDTTT